MEELNDKVPVIKSMNCFICRGKLCVARTSEYRKCIACGHEILVSEKGNGHMLNDPLDERDAANISDLDRFKTKILCRHVNLHRRTRLVDIGSATGKFLLQNAHAFKDAVGIEVTPQAVTFSRETLKLKVVNNIDEIAAPIDIACAWHSFEHIPQSMLIQLLSGLRRKMNKGGRLIISVPNSSSTLYRIFGGKYAFFDIPNHIHQFSPKSLKMLLSQYDFTPISHERSWPYNNFGYVQTLLNQITGTHNYLYYRLKRQSTKPSKALDAINFALLPIAGPIGIFFSLINELFPDNQGVLTLCFEKQKGGDEIVNGLL